MRTHSVSIRLFSSVVLATLCACSDVSRILTSTSGRDETKLFTEIVDNFPQPDHTQIIHLESTLQTGQRWRVWGSAEVWQHGVRFTEMRDFMAEIGVDLPSMDHEVSVVVQALPTTYNYLVARHERDSPTGGQFVLVEIDAITHQLRWIAGDDEPPMRVSYTAKVGDVWKLRVVGNAATFFVNGVVTLTLDLSPWPQLNNRDWVRVALAGFDSNGVFTGFVARTIPD